MPRKRKIPPAHMPTAKMQRKIKDVAKLLQALSEDEFEKRRASSDLLFRKNDPTHEEIRGCLQECLKPGRTWEDWILEFPDGITLSTVWKELRKSGYARAAFPRDYSPQAIGEPKDAIVFW